MRCAIMQPTYLPWPGYFNLICNVDYFVFLDNVQHEKQSWQTRNRILLQSVEHLLVVPTAKTPLSTLIKDIRLSDDSHWKRKTLSTLSAAYMKAEYGSKILELMEPFYRESKYRYLADFNIAIIRALCKSMDIKTRLLRASELNCAGGRSERLIKIAQALNCQSYLSPNGSMGYLERDRFEETSNLNVKYQTFLSKPYAQYKAKDFVSHLSLIDLIANHGFEYAKHYVLDQENI